MIQVLQTNPLLLLFLVASLGYAVGRVKVAGFSLGVAAVLFVGLAFGALSPDVRLPEIVYLLGLVLFVYTVGLASGPAFFSALRRRGLRQGGLALGLLGLGAGLAALAKGLLGLSGPLAAGLFAGAFTNTPALAGLLEALTARGAPEAARAEPVLAYSVAYPMGVIGTLLAIYVLQRAWRVPRAAPPEPLVDRSVVVRRPEKADALPEGVRLGRVSHAGRVAVAAPGTALAPGDVVSVIGPAREVDAAAAELGDASPDALDLDRRALDMRRVFVSRASLAGRALGDLHLPERFGAIVTRVRRGDVDFLARDATVLELGDRVRVVAPREGLAAVTAFFGDSQRRLSEIDVTSFSAGLALGLLLGLVPIPLPGGAEFRLGFAGGPLLVGLALGALGRTGPVVWRLPHGANLTLRQLGLILFLAGVGTRSGYAFASTVGGGLGLALFAAGAVMTAALALLALWLAVRVLKMPFATAAGLLAGLQTQPAVLNFAVEQTGSDEPNIAYATVYPLATIAKIVLAQALGLFLA